MAGRIYEILIVDDNSPDGTGAVVDDLVRELGDRLLVVHRAGKLGLGTAVMDGFLAAHSPVVGVMDADFSHHLYDLPQVHMNVSDGRSWVRGTHQQFDVLQMTLVDTWASTAAGAFALSENNLYTVEAFREYFEHLKPDGMIAITRWEFRHPHH